jgi:hypothetical protein
LFSAIFRVLGQFFQLITCRFSWEFAAFEKPIAPQALVFSKKTRFFERTFCRWAFGRLTFSFPFNVGQVSKLASQFVSCSGAGMLRPLSSILMPTLFVGMPPAKIDSFFISPIRQKSHEIRPSASPRFPDDFALFFTFSNNTHVESRGFPRVRGIAIPPTPAFLEENAVFFADFFPTVFQRCGFTRFLLT